MPFELSDTLPDVLRGEDVQWLRPSEIVPKPRFFSENHPEDHFARRFDVKKGFNGGFFLASVAGLTRYKEKFDKVVIPGQGINDGIFRFRFFENEGSEPREIQIDGRLPTLNGQLLFAKAPGDVFWCPLLEKAYAKFKGGYNQLNLGNMSSVLTHLTGKKGFSLNTSFSVPIRLYSRLSELMDKNRILSCKHKHYDNNNMDYGGSYTITGLQPSASDGYQIRVLDIMEEKEEWTSFEEFKKEYDVVFTNVENESEEEQLNRKYPSLMAARGGRFDGNGRDTRESYARFPNHDREREEDPFVLEEAVESVVETFENVVDTLKNLFR